MFGKRNITFKLGKEKIDELDDLAKSEGVSRSDLIREAIEQFQSKTPFSRDLDPVIEEVKEEARKEARERILSSDFLGPNEWDERLRKQRQRVSVAEKKYKEFEEKKESKLGELARAGLNGDSHEALANESVKLKEKWDLELNMLSKVEDLRTESEQMLEAVNEEQDRLTKQKLKTLARPIVEDLEISLKKFILDISALWKLQTSHHLWDGWSTKIYILLSKLKWQCRDIQGFDFGWSATSKSRNKPLLEVFNLKDE